MDGWTPGIGLLSRLWSLRAFAFGREAASMNAHDYLCPP